MRHDSISIKKLPSLPSHSRPSNDESTIFQKGDYFAARVKMCSLYGTSAHSRNSITFFHVYP